MPLGLIKCYCIPNIRYKIKQKQKITFDKPAILFYKYSLQQNIALNISIICITLPTIQRAFSKPLFKARIYYQTCITLPTIQRAFSKPLYMAIWPRPVYQVSLSSRQHSSSHSILTILLQANG